MKYRHTQPSFPPHATPIYDPLCPLQCLIFFISDQPQCYFFVTVIDIMSKNNFYKEEFILASVR